jgi:hypothetical protein
MSGNAARADVANADAEQVKSVSISQNKVTKLQFSGLAQGL